MSIMAMLIISICPLKYSIEYLTIKNKNNAKADKDPRAMRVSMLVTLYST